MSDPSRWAQWLVSYITSNVGGSVTLVWNNVQFAIRSTIGQHYLDGFFYTLGAWTTEGGALSADIIAWIISVVYTMFANMLQMIYSNIQQIIVGAYCTVAIRAKDPVFGKPLFYPSYDLCIESILGKQKQPGGGYRKTSKAKNKKRRAVSRKQIGGAEGEVQLEIKNMFINIFFNLTLLEITRSIYGIESLGPAIESLYEAEAITYDLTLQKSLGFEEPIKMILDETTAIVPYEAILVKSHFKTE
jgi:hypothetical protein